MRREWLRLMSIRILSALGLAATLATPAFAEIPCHDGAAAQQKKATTEPGAKSEKANGDEKSASSDKRDERSGKQKKEQAEKKGALKERVDPAKDAKAQKANIAQLRQNAAAERKEGNTVGAWAAEGDAKHAEKLLKKDQELLQKGETKKKVDGQQVK